MNKRYVIGALALGLGILLAACDHVAYVQQSAVNTASARKVLIEDYTGHKCGNCPAAARELRRLDSAFKGKIIPVAVHAGFYANVNSQYPTDFRNQAGNDYDNFFGNSVAGNPNGLINRAGYGTSALIKPWTDWGTAANLFFGSADFSLEIRNSIDSVSNQLSTTVTTKAGRTRTGTFNLVILVTEDSIIAEQIDYSLPAGSQFVTNYVFNHVLRGAMNGSWGTQLTNLGMVSGDSIVKTVSNYQLGANWNWKHCHVVAFIYDAKAGSATQYEVLQAEETEVK